MTIELPNYRIIGKLGVGAETRVFRARCMRTGRDYAVKIVKVTKPEDANFIDLLRAEHAIGSALDHPVLRKVYEFRVLRHRFRVHGAVLFMEFVDGVAMSEREYVRPIDETLRYFGEIALGLGAMHRAGYVHADLKPNNMLVTADGRVKLIDFGQSCRIFAAKTRVQGTMDYIAPEQVQRGVLDHRTDVFGLGAALHRVLTGRPVPTEMNQTVTMHSQSLIGKRVQEVRESAVEQLPAPVARLIEGCCALRPEDRIQDMQTVYERVRLARTVLSRPVPTTDSTDSTEKPGAVVDNPELVTAGAHSARRSGSSNAAAVPDGQQPWDLPSDRFEEEPDQLNDEDLRALGLENGETA